MKTILTLCSLVFASQIWAQTTLNTGHQFQNGVYQSLKDFKSDQPSLTWNELEAEVHINNSDYEAKFTNVVNKKGEAVDRSKFWGVAIKYVPYIRVNPYLENIRLSTNENDPELFVRLQAVGKLCYFYFEGYERVKIPITVYDPVTGIALRTSSFEKDKQVVVKKILDFETGKVYDYSLENFLSLIEKTDKGLHKTLSGLPIEEAREKLYKSLFIYNDRHPVSTYRRL